MELLNIAMADTFMKIFGYKRVKPTDKELKLKYRKREREVEDIERWLEDVKEETNKHDVI